MENERRTDYNVDMRPEEDFLSDILSASQIRATDTYETPPQIIWIDNSTIATLGNFSASTGKAKSKKTFNVSAIVAASLAGKQVLNYRAHYIYYAIYCLYSQLLFTIPLNVPENFFPYFCSRMPSAFLLRDARHAMHDIFFCASLQSCRRLYQMGD